MRPRQLPLKLDVGEESDGLQGLPETHLVGEDGVDAVGEGVAQEL